MVNVYRKRRVVIVSISLFLAIITIFANTPVQSQPNISNDISITKNNGILAIDILKKLKIKQRASNDGYSRDQFGIGWATTLGCDTRNIILNRDLEDVVISDKCDVTQGTLNDPYTGKIIKFVRGSDSSGKVQIDHVVALSDAWQKGAQLLSPNTRKGLANDPLELLAVDGDANMQKGNSDASEWLPDNKAFRCTYIARQIAVKQKYDLWVSRAEYQIMDTVLSSCNNQILPKP